MQLPGPTFDIGIASSPVMARQGLKGMTMDDAQAQADPSLYNLREQVPKEGDFEGVLRMVDSHLDDKGNGNNNEGSVISKIDKASVAANLYSGMGLSYTEKGAMRQRCRQLVLLFRVFDFLLRDGFYDGAEGNLERQLGFLQVSLF